MSAQDGSHFDPAAIDRQVERFTGAAIGELGGARQPVDRRLRLAACHAPLVLGWHGQRRDTVRVECPDQGGWRIFVATSGGAREQGQPAIRRGERVTIAVRGRGFTISHAGEAMEAGTQGEWIRVRPVDGSDPVRGQIVRPGLVELPLG